MALFPLGKVLFPLYPQLCSIVPLLFFSKNAFGIKYPTKIDMPSYKETRLNIINLPLGGLLLSTLTLSLYATRWPSVVTHNIEDDTLVRWAVRDPTTKAFT